jgi:hypothetical protein
MKSLRAKPQASVNKKPSSEIPAQLHLAHFLKDIISSDPKSARVVEVDLYMKNYTVSLNFTPETDSWESCFTKHFDSYIRMRFLADAVIVTDVAGVLRVQPVAPSALTEEHGTSITILTKIDNAEIKWEHRTDDGIDVLLSTGYEKAETVTGPFPLQYILNYIEIAKYKIYATPKSVHASPNESILAERDYAVQLIQFLQHMAVTKHAGGNVSNPTNSGYKPRMHHTTTLLRTEADKVQTPGTESKSTLRRQY